MSWLDRIEAANRVDLSGSRPWRVGRAEVGWINPWFAELLAGFPEVFEVHEAQVRFVPRIESLGPRGRTAALAEVTSALRAAGHYRGWRDEPYPVVREWSEPALAQVERAAAPSFGITGFGVHLNGYVRRRDGLHLWVATRSSDKVNDPGKLDQIVAGGQPAGLGLVDNLLKECDEEAAIPAALAGTARAAGTVSYALSTPEGLRPDVLFVFDLELPEDFVPRSNDAEVERFELWPIERVAEVVGDSEAFKFNCALVVIDFMIRHGVIPPETPGYARIVAGLRGREQFRAQRAGPA